MSIRLFAPFLFIATLFGCASESGDSSTVAVPTTPTTISSIYPKPPSGHVGDPMPFFEDGKLNMFYLYDARDGQVGFHPYNLMTTDNLTKWVEQGTVIPVVNDNNAIDLALGTGSIIKDNNGLYHAFYTGFNDRNPDLPYKEIIQHATSTDNLNWIKHPEDGFYGQSNDFRDPYVRYMDEFNEYWMIITTRSTDSNTPILSRYTSTDLKTWVNHGTFFSDPSVDRNMECSTLIKIGNYWYLSFSRQGSGNERVLHYYFTDNLQTAGTHWKKPAQTFFDGPGQYAARIEKFNQRILVSGWVGTKAGRDSVRYDWAGNLVTHELKQQDNGELLTAIPEEYIAFTPNAYSLKELAHSSSTVVTEPEIQFTGSEYEYVEYSPLPDNTVRIHFTVSPRSDTNTGQYGFMFALADKNGQIKGDTKLAFDPASKKITLLVNNFSVPRSSNSIKFDLPTGEFEVTLFKEFDILTLYIDQQVAFTARLPSIVDKPWGIFSSESELKIKGLKAYSR
ncbi:MAG: beta-fructofuranosidase [Oleiphilaceae bacterium]|jgi:beta-fructofuranosidase